jgi:hypothetical protein
MHFSIRDIMDGRPFYGQQIHIQIHMNTEM